MPSLFNKVGEAVKKRWEERQADKRTKAQIDAEVKAERKKKYYETYRAEKTRLSDETVKEEAKRDARGRKLSAMKVDLGKASRRAGGSASAGLDFLSKDMFGMGGGGSSELFSGGLWGTSPTRKRKGESSGGSKTISVKAGSTRISIRSGPEEGEKKPRQRSIAENIEDLISLNGDAGARGKKGVKSMSDEVEDLLGF